MKEENLIIESSWQAVTSAEDIFFKDLPPGVTMLPKDWEGETTRVYMNFAVSDQAVKNEKFAEWGLVRPLAQV